MRFQEKIRIILKYVSGLLAAIAVIGLIGTTGSDFLGNISYMQMAVSYTHLDVYKRQIPYLYKNVWYVP